MSSLPVSINIHLLLFILSGLFCVFLAVLLFKKDIDDGSRLVTSTKPLSRPAMFCCKFGTYVSVCILTAIISLVITAFSMFLPKGFDDIKTFDSIYTSIIVADIVMFFVFGSVSIFLAQLISSVGMMSSVVGGAVMLSVIDILAPVIVDSNQTIIEEKTGAVADSYKYFQYDGTINTLANLDNSSYNLKTEWNKINKFSPTKVTGAFDVANQLVTTLNMFKMEENNNDHIKRNALGASQHYQYKISSESIIKELNDFSTTIPALIPMHFGVGASMQSKFGTVGYSFNESSYDEITSMMNIEPIGYYISCTTGKLTFVY
jgi:ABC-type transport system involved in multi-copper enzyme maturation permease subunit